MCVFVCVCWSVNKRVARVRRDKPKDGREKKAKFREAFGGDNALRQRMGY